MMRRVCIAAMTGEQPSWNRESLRLGPFHIGRGCKFIPQELTAEGLGVFHGDRALEVLAAHDVVILQHWPNAWLLDYLRARGIRTGLWMNVASVQRSPLWNTVQEPLRRVCTLFPLAGTDGKNVETWPGADAVDTSAPILPDALAGVLDYVMRTTYNDSRPDFLFVDELTDYWYCRAANAPERDAHEWRSGIERVVNALQGLLPVWGHNTGEAFQAIRTRVYEHATRGVTSAGGFALRVRDLAAMARGSKSTARVVLGWERADDIPAAYMKDLDTPLAELLVQTARTGRAFQIFDPWAA